MKRGPYLRHAELDARLAAAPVRDGRPMTAKRIAKLTGAKRTTIQNIERLAFAKFRRRAPHLAIVLERGGLYG